MLMSNDLRCADCDYTEIDAIYERNDGPPVCPDCGAERTPDWSTGRAPAISGHGPGSFVPRDMGAFGVCETKEDYTRVENMIKKRFPGHSIRVEADSAADRRNRANDARHRLWSQRKKVGLDARQVSEMNIEKARTKGIKNAKVLNKTKPAPVVK